MISPRSILSALIIIGLAAIAQADVTLVRDGQPAATIVLAEKPTRVARYAAEELVYHIEKATGVKLPIACECDSISGPAIYIGETEAARAAGITAAALPLETFRLKATADGLFIAGKDSEGDPLERDTSAGTLFGVYEWLERDLGVRWLWPGELGTFVPPARTITARSIDVTVSPRFFQRHLRSGLGFKTEHPALGFTPKAAEAYARDQTVFLRRHRMGRSVRMSYGHAFNDWWKEYGRAHPEWFQLVNGKRGPVKPGARYSMCVSNPGLHREIVARWKAKGGHLSPQPFLNIVENDIIGLCECDNCRAWDGPPPPDVMKFYARDSKVYGTQFVSDRYARFEMAVRELAARENPNVSVVGYVYFNYFQAPTSGVKLNEHVVLGYCPSGGWYPRADDEHAWYQKQWRGWAESGARLFFRVNYFLDGYSMPFIFAHQFADDFQYAARNKMAASDFDSLTGQWGTQGPNLYLLLRLHSQPLADPDALLGEYYSGFGPAAASVKAYFDYWERYTMDHRPRLADAFANRVASRWRSWAKVPHQVYPAEVFPPAEQFLAKAATAAAKNPDALARVEFLRLGLAHAKLCLEAARQLTLADATSTPERGKDALHQLLTFRRAHERTWIANLNHNAWVEEASWKLSAETKQEPDLYP